MPAIAVSVIGAFFAFLSVTKSCAIFSSMPASKSELLSEAVLLTVPLRFFDGSITVRVHVVRGWGASPAGVGCTWCGGAFPAGVHIVRGLACT